MYLKNNGEASESRLLFGIVTNDKGIPWIQHCKQPVKLKVRDSLSSWRYS